MITFNILYFYDILLEVYFVGMWKAVDTLNESNFNYITLSFEDGCSMSYKIYMYAILLYIR